MSPAPLRILWLATKPPWPAVDGGRLLMDLTLRALAEQGHEITVIAPAIAPIGATPSGLRSWWVKTRLRPAPLALLWSLCTGRPLTAVRHRHRGMRLEVAALLRRRAGEFDVVHVEQLQALSHLPDRYPGAVVLRAQNVESALWRQAAAHARGLRAWLLAHEASRLAAWEADRLRPLASVVALSAEDAARLIELSGRPVECLNAPFPADWPQGAARLAGDPALVVLGSARWLPNRDALGWLLAELWPPVRAAHPGARLHLFDPPASIRFSEDAVIRHEALAQSADAFAAGALLLVPLRMASGVRMKILEAFARGVPVIATPQAAAGLGASHRVHLYLAETAAELGAAIAALRDPREQRRLSARARALLLERHRPETIAARLVEIYRRASASPPRPGR